MRVPAYTNRLYGKRNARCACFIVWYQIYVNEAPVAYSHDLGVYLINLTDSANSGCGETDRIRQAIFVTVICFFVTLIGDCLKVIGLQVSFANFFSLSFLTHPVSSLRLSFTLFLSLFIFLCFPHCSFTFVPLTTLS